MHEKLKGMFSGTAQVSHQFVSFFVSSVSSCGCDYGG